MSIARVVDHLYVIDTKDDHVAISFLTNRTGWFLPVFLLAGLCLAVLWTAFHFHWNMNVIAGVVGGSISMTASMCFAVAEHITRYRITIEPDVISFQREFEGIPVGRRKIYARNLMTDLGMYPVEDRGNRASRIRLGRLCVWVDGKSIDIENYFPISEGASLAEELKRRGIEFPRTFPEYQAQYLMFASSLDYFSF